MEYVPVFTLTPRFILSVRALYARDLQGGSVPHGIDTEFSFTPVSGGGIRESVIVFAEPDEEGLEQDKRYQWKRWEYGVLGVACDGVLCDVRPAA